MYVELWSHIGWLWRRRITGGHVTFVDQGEMTIITPRIALYENAVDDPDVAAGFCWFHICNPKLLKKKLIRYHGDETQMAFDVGFHTFLNRIGNQCCVRCGYYPSRNEKCLLKLAIIGRKR
jgi:hypothetical protein